MDQLRLGPVVYYELSVGLEGGCLYSNRASRGLIPTSHRTRFVPITLPHLISILILASSTSIPEATQLPTSSTFTTQNPPLHALHIALTEALGPSKILQPRLHAVPRIRRPGQTLPGDVAVGLDVVDQTVFGHVVVLGPDEAEDEQVERGAVEIRAERVQDVDLDAAHCVAVEGVVAD